MIVLESGFFSYVCTVNVVAPVSISGVSNSKLLIHLTL